MKPKVVITQMIHREVIELLEQQCEVVPNNTPESLDGNEILRRAKDADGIMVFMSDRIDDDFLRLCPNLKIVAAALKGYDNFDIDSCAKRGIWFTTVPDLLTIPTAELTIGLLIGLTRNIFEGDRQIRSGQFSGWRPRLYGAGLAGKKLGIVGMGALGQALAKRLSCFDMLLYYFDPVPLAKQKESSWGLSLVSFHHILTQSDYLVLAVPLKPDTFHLIDQDVLAIIKPGMFLLNTCRGSVVDEDAVAASLANGRLAGYAADVFEMEDWARQDRPTSIPKALIKMTSATLLTPHIGSALDDARREIELQAAHNILEAFQGKRPSGAINNIANNKIRPSEEESFPLG